MFAVPYFVYDIYAMFMCYWYKLRVKGHEEASAAPQQMSSALTSYLRREFLMVLHHVVMVTVCFPVSVVTVPFPVVLKFAAEKRSPDCENETLQSLIVSHSFWEALIFEGT